MAEKLGVAKESGSSVVVSVEEGWVGSVRCANVVPRTEVLTQWLLLEKQEASVNQFEVLGEVVEL